jgi:hypothetical protein
MKQEVIIKANAHEDLKPLVVAAIRNQMKLLQQDIDASLERIAGFEKRTGLSSNEFEEKMSGHEIEESLDTLDWTMELASLRLLQRKFQYLCEAEIS